jgi:hypothetical protein
VRTVVLPSIFLTWLLPAGLATADEGLRVWVNWERLADAMRGAAPFLSREAWFPSAWGKAREMAAERPRLRLSPQLSVVARDWGGAQSLIGPLALTDRLRLSRSSRMVIGRLCITHASVAPFAQAGLGQWRIDTDLLPVMPRDVELAGQVGGGFEFRLNPGTTVGVEADYTILYREQHEPQMISAPRQWGTYLAARALF